jgi:hypothetical protein
MPEAQPSGREKLALCRVPPKAAQEPTCFGGDGCAVTRRSHHVGHNRSGAASLVPCCRLVPPTALLVIAGGPVARVGGPLAFVGEVVAFIGGPLAFVSVVLDPQLTHSPRYELPVHRNPRSFVV